MLWKASVELGHYSMRFKELCLRRELLSDIGPLLKARYYFHGGKLDAPEVGKIALQYPFTHGGEVLLAREVRVENQDAEISWKCVNELEELSIRLGLWDTIPSALQTHEYLTCWTWWPCLVHVMKIHTRNI